MTTEREKNRIRRLHKEFSVIKEITVNESQLLTERPTAKEAREGCYAEKEIRGCCDCYYHGSGSGCNQCEKGETGYGVQDIDKGIKHLSDKITVNESQLLLEKPPCNPTAGGYDGSVGQATEACRELGTACINYAASPGFFGCMVNPTMTYGGWSCGSCGGSVTNDGPTKLWADKYETPRDAGTTNGGSGDKGSDFVKKSISEKGVSRISERNLKILIRRAVNEQRAWGDCVGKPCENNCTNAGEGDCYCSDGKCKAGSSNLVSKNVEKEIGEVYSEKQRRWACAQSNLPNNKRQKSLSKKEAEEMCKDVNFGVVLCSVVASGVLRVRMNVLKY